MSFHIGQIVVHNADGICTIMSETEMYGMNFYLLIPKYDPNAKIYIPIDQADDYIRRLLTVKEADELIDYIGTIDDSLVDSSKQRRDEFKRIFNSSDDLKDMAYLARKLYLLKKEREKKNLKIGLQDSMMLEAANRLIVDELSIVYNVKSSEIEGLIDSKIKK